MVIKNLYIQREQNVKCILIDFHLDGYYVEHDKRYKKKELLH